MRQVNGRFPLRQHCQSPQRNCVMNVCSKTFPFVLACSVFLFPCQPADGQVPVRHTEGLVHGFLVLRTLEGGTLAHGDLIQMAHADRVTTHLIFHFKDGSLHDETAVYSQLRSFRLLRYHLVQKGPSLSSAKDISIDVPSGQVTVRYSGDDGKEQVTTEYMKLPVDLHHLSKIISVILREVNA